MSVLVWACFLTCGRDADLLRAGVLGCSLCEATILASVLRPCSTDILSLVLGSDRMQYETVIFDTHSGCPELSFLCSHTVLWSHGQNACRVNAGQLNTSPEPGYREEPFLQVLRVYVAG